MTLRFLCTLGLAVVLGLATSAVAHGQSPVQLDAGDAAPAFTLPASDGETYSLADFKGKSAVILAWFPKAFTGG